MVERFLGNRFASWKLVMRIKYPDQVNKIIAGNSKKAVSEIKMYIKNYVTIRDM